MCNVLGFSYIQAFSSLVKVDFWTELARRKLDTYRLNDDAQVQLALTDMSSNLCRWMDNCFLDYLYVILLEATS